MKLKILVFLLLASILVHGSEGLKLVVLNEHNKPVYDAFVCHKGFVVTNTDNMGRCTIHHLNTDTLHVRYLGYKHHSIILSLFHDGDSLLIRLIPDTVQLKEIVVNMPDYLKLLKTASLNFNKSYPSEHWLCHGIYTKATMQNMRYVDFGQYAGYTVFPGAGNRKDPIINGWNFFPEHARCSKIFQNESSYQILEPQFTSNHSHMSNQKHLTTHYAHIERYGPQNPSMLKYYDFSLAGISDSIIAINFKVNRKHLPKKIEIDGRGRILIDARKQQIIELSFDQILIHISEKESVIVMYPQNYATAFTVRFLYKNERPFPREIVFNRQWLNDRRSNRIYCTWHPRPRPSETKVTETECFVVDAVQKHGTGDRHENKKLFFHFNLLCTNEKVNYNPTFWENVPIPSVIEQQRLFADLSMLSPLEKQFEEQNGLYMLDEHYLDVYLRPEYHEQFHNAWENSQSLSEKLRNYEYQEMP